MNIDVIFGRLVASFITTTIMFLLGFFIFEISKLLARTIGVAIIIQLPFIGSYDIAEVFIAFVIVYGVIFILSKERVK